MRILKENVRFDEILQHCEEVNCGYQGYAIGLEYLAADNLRCQGRWTLLLLSCTDIASVMLPGHDHPSEVIPPTGLTVSATLSTAAQPLTRVPECTGFVDFENFIFMCVLFSPEQLERKNLRKLRSLLREVFSSQSHGTIRR